MDGYLVEIGLPVSVAGPGGRYAADVLGARVRGQTLEIYHIECGQLSGGQKSVNSLQKKFSNHNCARIENYFRQKLGFRGTNVDYHKTYVASFWSEPTMQGAENLRVNVRPLPEFLRSEAIQTIRKWKADPPQQPRTTGKHITLPESFWRLQLIDYLFNKGLLEVGVT